MVAENGIVLAESERFRREGELLVVDVDTERLRVERARQTSFADAVHAAGPAAPAWSRSRRCPPRRPAPLLRAGRPAPVRARPTRPRSTSAARRSSRSRRPGSRGALEHIGVGSAGARPLRRPRLDAGPARLRAHARPARPAARGRAGGDDARLRHHGAHARAARARLAAALGRRAARDRHPRRLRAAHRATSASTPPTAQSVTFQNLQARERTQVLMDLANMEGGLVVGTGDLSELALGFAHLRRRPHRRCTTSTRACPRRWCAQLVALGGRAPVAARARAGRAAGGARHAGLARAAAARRGRRRSAQQTEDLIGPYELHDFFLYCLVRLGAGPRKILYLAGPRVRGPLRRGGELRALAARLPRALLRPAVQALGDARRAEGRLREPVAARRLAHAERRLARGVAARARARRSGHDPRRRRLGRGPVPRPARHAALPQQRRAARRGRLRRRAPVRPGGQARRRGRRLRPARRGGARRRAAAGPLHAAGRDRGARPLGVLVRPPGPARRGSQRDPAAAARGPTGTTG